MLPGQDLLAQARSGLMWLNGDRDQGPVPFGLAIADLLAGGAIVQGVLAALVRRGRTGEGAHIETSLLEALVDFQFEVLDDVSQRRRAHADALGVPQRARLSRRALRRLPDARRLARHRHDAARQARGGAGLAVDRRLAGQGRLRAARRDQASDRRSRRARSRRPIGSDACSRSTSGAPRSELAGPSRERGVPQARHAADRRQAGRAFGAHDALLPFASTASARDCSAAAPRIGEHTEALRAEMGL